MELFITLARRLRVSERKFIADHLTRPGSDFQKALLAGTPIGTIAICFDHGEIVGWARTEMWKEKPTLEAFVAKEYRKRGIAKMCAAGLLAEGALPRGEWVAVFRESMSGLASSLEIPNVLYNRKPDGSWRCSGVWKLA
jgi:GNAT superfamily N-acetyltransferase